VTYENRLTLNYAFGTLTSAAALGDPTLTSTDFATGLPTLAAGTTTYIPVTLQDPTTKIYEIVWVNAHTAAATTATVLRGREGTTARAWGSGTLWTVSPTLRDGVLPVTTRSALPVDPHIGLRAEIQDEQVVVEYALSVGWLNITSTAFRANNLLAIDTASITFSAIPSTLKRLNLAWTARSTVATVYCDIRMRINGDSGANYNLNHHNQLNATITSFATTAALFATIGVIPGATAVANNFGAGEIVFPAWDAPHPGLDWHFHSHFFDSAANSVMSQGGGVYPPAGPFVSVNLFPETGSFKAGSEFTVYGMA
jgi:hypothetical protein